MNTDTQPPDLPVPLSFSLSELAGSLGDFGTIIPLILAVALVSDVNPRYILLFFGIWFILTGLYYRLPIPLEPMKAIAVVVIAAGAAGVSEPERLRHPGLCWVSYSLCSAMDVFLR